MVNEIFLKVIYVHLFLFTDMTAAIDRDYFGFSISVVILSAVIINIGRVVVNLIRGLFAAFKIWYTAFKKKIKSKKVMTPEVLQ